MDGKQVGGTQMAQASHAADQDQNILVDGNFGTGTHTVSVDFLNDLYEPGVGDRNLYVDGASYDGAAQTDTTLALMSQGTQSFQVTQPDVLTLNMAEDAYDGDAQFTVSVDGKQVGGTYTATASHSAGASQQVDIGGNWGSGTHSVAVNFVNDFYTPGVGDRNLYVDGASYDGAAQPATSLSLYSSGTQTFTAVSSTTYSEGAAGGTVTTLGNDTVDVGSGNVTINADGPSTDVIGGVGAMAFIASSGNDSIMAGAGTSIVGDGSGTLSFTASSGLATITAGTGKELFNFVDGRAGGSLTVNGFHAGTDFFHLQGYSGNGVQSQQAIAGGSTLITLTDSTKITLAGYTASSVHPIFG